MVAWWRACESRSPSPLVEDAFAVEMAERWLPEAKRRQYSRSPIFQTTVDILAVRTVLIDEAVEAWCTPSPTLSSTLSSEVGGTQVVNLGAGVDSRPYRLTLPPKATVYQVDTEAVTRWSESFFAPHAASCRVVRVAADLHDPEACLAELCARGFDPRRPVLWILEGLLEFLDRALVPELLAALTASSPAGSRLLAQLLDPELVAFARERGDAGFPFKRLEPLASVQGHLTGWRLDVISCETMNARFGRGLGNLFHLLDGERQGSLSPRPPAAR